MKNFRANKIKLEKISEASSPENLPKEIQSPMKTSRGRIMMGGMGDSYLSFFKLESETEPKNIKITSDLKRNEASRSTIAEKDQIIHNLQ